MTTWTHDRILTHFKGMCLVGSWLKSTIFTNRCSFLKPVSFEPITRAINGMWSTDSIYLKVLRLILTAPSDSDQKQYIRLSDFVESTVAALCYNYQHLVSAWFHFHLFLNMFNRVLLGHGIWEVTILVVLGVGLHLLVHTGKLLQLYRQCYFIYNIIYSKVYSGG